MEEKPAKRNSICNNLASPRWNMEFFKNRFLSHCYTLLKPLAYGCFKKSQKFEEEMDFKYALKAMHLFCGFWSISNQHWFDYWKVIFFLPNDLPLGMGIEKSWKELLIFIYVGKHHFEHSVCLTKSFFTFLSWDSPSKEMCSLTILWWRRESH